MTDTKALARLLVLQAAILHVLKDADAETRDQARQVFDAADAATAWNGKTELGRVRRDRPRHDWIVVDWAAYEQWAREEVPEACNAVSPWLLKSIKRDGGVFIRKATGEILEPKGLALQEESEGRLVVTTTDAAIEWAHAVVGEQLKAIEP